ncbi:MAG: DUF2274 domain-containing protein [Alphaproteobacteria bacterium]|nr:DUF2274 domain-containing protein [Alphaproteobacteria bacterium]MDE2014829.1 DUF2274 domain-containing protein [Alphaproteobacteria bacterium]MDE2074963.1 DUF2274 domain-containing protein [Alphaproteobacteria bacterium]MDE2353330.1 DUF2274 domain-containing protein [Alphaproteobacteria bacterium]
MKDLKLGPLPKAETSKLTITLSKPLRDALELYVSDYASAYEPTELSELVPHMLEAFLRSDRAFMKRHAESVRAQASQMPAPLPSATTLRSPVRESSS